MMVNRHDLVFILSYVIRKKCIALISCKIATLALFVLLADADCFSSVYFSSVFAQLLVAMVTNNLEKFSRLYKNVCSNLNIKFDSFTNFSIIVEEAPLLQY